MRNSDEAARRPPIILFDGVCNLCNAAVQWIIARDRRAQFRFASLQSDAGRQALASAGATGPLPDSIVLIDGERVLTRSDAAIAIARYLGVPWSLASVALLLPRSLRDALYAFIARNRYRWFGRQAACWLPTPSLRSRFLDAESVEASPESPTTPGAQEPEDSLLSPDRLPAPASGEVSVVTALAGWLKRFLLAYLVVYIVPFPAGLIPLTSWVRDLHVGVLRPIVLWIGQVVFGVEITVMPNGSGDTTYNYVEVFVFVLLALVLASLWSLRDRGRALSPRVEDVIRVYVRYCVAMFMFSYGWSKVFPIQMPFPGPDRLIGSIGDMSPMGLVWTFIGSSTAYQIFAGAGEVLAGLLLLSRRTALAGSLVATVVMTNVVALNFSFDVPVKLFSSHLLLMSLFLAMPHAPRLLAVLVLNLPAQPIPLRPFPARQPWMRRGAMAAKLLVVFLIAVTPALDSWYFLRTSGLLAPKQPWHGLYRVESFTRDGVDGRSLDDHDRWIRVGLDSAGIGAIQRADGSSRRQLMRLDESKGTLTISRRGEPDVMTLNVVAEGGDVLTISGVFEGATIEARLKRADDSESLLTSRGFRWINEFPLNR